MGGIDAVRSDDDDIGTLFEGYCFQGADTLHNIQTYMNSSRHHEEIGSSNHLASACKGHHADDMTMFKSMVKNTETGEYVYRATTNLELFQMINPAEYQGSYIYENFEWKHCTGAYSFPGVDWGNITSYSDTNTDDASHSSA